jgi:hypothetical protein
MNDIYEQKAKKYKYKYLKLKKKYISEGGLSDSDILLKKYLNSYKDKLSNLDRQKLEELNNITEREKKEDEIKLKKLLSVSEQQEALNKGYQQLKQQVQSLPQEARKAQSLQNSAPRLLQQARRAPQALETRPQAPQAPQAPLALEKTLQAQSTSEHNFIQAPQAPLALEKTLQAQLTREHNFIEEPQPQAVTWSFNKQAPIEHSKVDAPQKYKLVHSNIGEGGFGCIISPPYKFTNELDVQNFFNIYDIEYVGKLIIIINESDKKSFMKEVENNKIISSIYDIEGKYTSKFMFSQYINYNIVIQNMIHINGLEECLKKHNLYRYAIIEFGYMILKNVGTSFFNFNLRERKLDDFKLILKNLKESIEQFFINKNFYKNEYIHGDINFQNMTLDNNLNVYFIDFGLMQKYTDLNKINGLNLQYLQILYFLQFFESDIKNNIYYTKIDLITKINDLKNKFNNGLKKHGNKAIKIRYDTKDLLEKEFLEFINYEYFFQSIKNDNEQHLLNDFFNPIAKNIDIYALSLFIYQLFNHIPNQTKLNININIELIDPNAKALITNILNALMRNALYNNINGPEELIIYLDGIIESMNDNSIKGTIPERIKSSRDTIPERIKSSRDTKGEQFYDYYDNFYIKVPVLTDNVPKFYYQNPVL